MNVKKIVAWFSLIPMLLAGIFGVHVKAENAEQPVRLAAYSHDNLYDGEIYEDFEDYEIIENDDGFVINAYQTYERDDFSEVDGLDIPSGDYVRVKYVETYIDSETNNYSPLINAKLRRAFKEEWVDHGYDEWHDYLWEYDDATKEFSYIFE